MAVSRRLAETRGAVVHRNFDLHHALHNDVRDGTVVLALHTVQDGFPA